MAIKARISSCCASAHARMRRHLERAELDQPEAPGRAVGRVELVDADLGAVRVAGHVDQQVAEDAVDEPWRYAALRRVGDLLQRDFHLEERFVTRFVERVAPGSSGR